MPGCRPDVVTYGRLITDAARYVSLLKSVGVGRDDVVLCISPTSVDLIFAFVATTLIGAVPAMLPFPTPKLDPDEYHHRLSALVAYTRPAAILTTPELKDELTEHLAGEGWLGRVLSWEDAVRQGVEFVVDDAVSMEADGPAVLQYSSGTTGLQKGVVLSHRALFNHLRSYTAAISLAPDDVVVSWLPLYHDMGLIAGFLMPLLTRTPLVLMSPLDWVREPGMLLRAVDTYRGTLTWLPNFAYSFLAAKVREDDLQGCRLDSLRAVINCSEPMSAHSHDLFARRFSPYGFHPDALATCYAMAENTFAVTQGGIGRPSTQDVIDGAALAKCQRAQPVSADCPTAKTMVSAGSPIDGVHVRVVSDGYEDLFNREIGEIAIKSDCMLTEYFHRPDLTADAFHDGWFLTGDYGYVADGQLYVTGRKKDLIIVGGSNIYPNDIEAAVNTVAGVHPGRCVAFGLYDEQTGTETVVVIAEVDGEDERHHQAIKSTIRDRVARSNDCVVRRIHLVRSPWLLKTSSGKIARRANREKYCHEMGIDAW